MYLIALFLAIRLFSFLTVPYPLLNELVAFLVIILFVYLCFKNLSWAWLILVGELLLDGAGHFLEFQHLILRTWLLLIFVCFWWYQKIKNKQFKINLPQPLLIGLSLMLMAVVWSTIRGFILQHATLFILQDAMLYFFILLFLPGLDFSDITKQKLWSLVKVFVIGSTIFAFFTFIIYSTGWGVLQDSYYHWFRDITGGKITDLGHNFFRIVLPEQLFIVPLILIFASLLIKQTKKEYWVLVSILILILVLNFSRIYFLALFFGFLVLLYKNSFKNWLRTVTSIVLLLAVIFVGLNLLSSRGESWGGELLGVKLSGVSAPEADLSGAIRLAMLPDILHTLKQHPILGSGLGTTVSYLDPLTKQIVSRTQFDWGYLEMLAELGAVGLLFFIFAVGVLLFYLYKIGYNNEDPGLNQGLLAGALSLFVINLTTPALFQGFGLLYFAFLIVFIYVRRTSH